ncbi:subclass B1 metallo-beta-lactamase, long type [Bacteroidota bacterium]
MKRSIALLCGYIICIALLSQEQNIGLSQKFQLTKLSEQVYIHTYDNSNGIIYINDGEAIIVSTPPSDEITSDLINHVQNEFQSKIVGYVIDRWHPDAMEGLDVVHEAGIESFANEITCNIAIEKKLPIPKNSFHEKLELKVGDKKMICHYFGPAHTEDGIVVWIPDEKVLFGGNEIRNYNGWIGNITDANLLKWSETIEKVKEEYGHAKIVIPGHGLHGGPELLDYTINLYTPSKWGEILKKHNISPKPIFDEYDRVFITADQDSVTDNEVKYYKNAIVFIDKDDQYVMIESPQIQHIIPIQRISSDYGRIRILNKIPDSNIQEVDGYYKRLILNLRDDEVKMEIILRELIR